MNDRESTQPALRASDGDRERVATVLRDAYADGRLNYDELQDRLARAYGSRTLAELSPLTGDLQAAPSNLARPTAAPAARGTSRARMIRDRVLAYVILMVFLIAVWAVTGMHGSFWPIWPILVGGLILAFDVFGLERPGRGRHRAHLNERAARRDARQDRRTKRSNDGE